MEVGSVFNGGVGQVLIAVGHGRRGGEAGHGEGGGGGYLQCRNVGHAGDNFQSRAGHAEGRNAFLKSIDGYYRQG